MYRVGVKLVVLRCPQEGHLIGFQEVDPEGEVGLNWQKGVETNEQLGYKDPYHLK